MGNISENHLFRQARLAEAQADGQTDGQLLERFVDRNDEAAFEVLVHRHGRMVWGVCRRTLRDRHDAEDAFQATFLVLVRRARSILPREQVANWLYGVACLTARKALTRAAARALRERPVAELPDPVAPEQPACPGRELDDEVRRLPDRYRTVLLLCDLGGHTRSQAARLLGVSEGTVAGWQTRARRLLRERLTRRGLAVSAGAAGIVVPPAIVSATVRFAPGWVALTEPIPASVFVLTNGVLTAMRISRLKAAAAAVLLTAFVCLGGAIVAGRSPDAPPAAGNGNPVAPAAVGQPQATQVKATRFNLICSPATGPNTFWAVCRHGDTRLVITGVPATVAGVLAAAREEVVFTVVNLAPVGNGAASETRAEFQGVTFAVDAPSKDGGPGFRYTP